MANQAPVNSPCDKRRIDPTDGAAMNKLGERFWLNELHPCMTQRTLDLLDLYEVQNVDRFVVTTGLDCGCSEKSVEIATLDVPGSITAARMLECVWSSYILSLEATMKSGKNERAHMNDDDTLPTHARALAERIGATITPCDEIYGSGGTYLEDLDFSYDPATRTLTADPCIGS